MTAPPRSVSRNPKGTFIRTFVSRLAARRVSPQRWIGQCWKERPMMPRIGTVIGDVYRRPGADALPAHLEDHYGIRVAGMTKLATGVFRVHRDNGPPWVARMSLTSRPLGRTVQDAEVLRFLERRQFPAERCAHPKPVTTLGDRAVLVTGYVAGQRPPSDPATRRKLGD